MEKLVERAKAKEESATEEIIEKIKYLIFKEASKYHIPAWILIRYKSYSYVQAR
ncbi:hypothetical protein [Clostridium sp.]|uniref:hypothetical protein n=1 Tax=Clostridium sp. TaxID=1506 RepID=UPI003D6CCEE2